MTDKPDEEIRAAREDGIHPFARPFLFLDDTRARNIISAAVLALAVILLLADLLVSRHDYLHFAETRTFYALAGAAALSIVVLSAWPLRALLGRKEDYYGEPDDDA